MKDLIKGILTRIGLLKAKPQSGNETSLLAIGALLSNQQWLLNSFDLNHYEFKIFSQFGDDGIIQFLIKNIEIKNKIFIEFGVENFQESNSRFLMMNNNWKGFVMDGSKEAIEELRNRDWFWKYDLSVKAVFIDRENINELLHQTGFSDIGLLHVDLDGNDYHIFTELDLSLLNPAIVLLEYNSVFGNEKMITVPYQKDFARTKAHYTNLYWGASLPALQYAAQKKGYALVGSNLAGCNAYFVRKDLLGEKIKEVSVKEAYKESLYRESRNQDYSLSYLTGKDRLNAIRGMKVINVLTGIEEIL